MVIQRNAPLILAIGFLALITTLFLFYSHITNSAGFFGAADSCELQAELSTPPARKELWESSNAVIGPRKQRYKGVLPKLRRGIRHLLNRSR